MIKLHSFKLKSCADCIFKDSCEPQQVAQCEEALPATCTYCRYFVRGGYCSGVIRTVGDGSFRLSLASTVLVEARPTEARCKLHNGTPTTLEYAVCPYARPKEELC